MAKLGYEMPSTKKPATTGPTLNKPPGQGQGPSPAPGARAPTSTLPPGFTTEGGGKNQNNVFSAPTSPTIPNGSGPGTGVNPGGAKNGSTAPPGGTGLPLTGGGTSPPDPRSMPVSAYNSGVAANTFVGQPIGEQGMWDSANQTGMNWFSQGQQLTGQLPGTNTLGGSAPQQQPFSGGQPQIPQAQGQPAGQQPAQVAGTFSGPANQPAFSYPISAMDPFANPDGQIGGPGPGEYYPGNGVPEGPYNNPSDPTQPGSDQGYGNPYGPDHPPAYDDQGNIIATGEDPNNPGAGYGPDPTGLPFTDIYGPGGMEGPFNNPNDPTVPMGTDTGQIGSDGNPVGQPGDMDWMPPLVGNGPNQVPPASNQPPAQGGGSSPGGGTFVGTDPATGNPIFSGNGGSGGGGGSPSPSGPINPATGSPAGVDPYGPGGQEGPFNNPSNPTVPAPTYPTNGGSGGSLTLNPPAAPPFSGGSSSGASGGGGSNVATNTNNLTFQAPKAVGQQSESFSEDYGEGGGKSQSQNSSSSSSVSRSENKSNNEAQSTSTGRAQDKSLSSSSSDVKHTFDPSQAKDFVGDVAREQMPSSPFSQDDAQRSLNQANARVAAGSAAQQDQLNAQLAGAGFDPNSAAGRSLAQQIMRDRLSQEVQNSVNIPMEFAQKHGAFEQANAGMNVTQRGQDVQREGLTTSLINSLLGQQASQSQGMSEGFSNQDSQSTSFGSSSGFSDSSSLANSQGWSESEDWRKNQGKSGSFSVPVFA